MKLLISKNIAHKRTEAKDLLLKALKNMDEYELSEFQWVREYQEALIKYIEDVIQAVGIGVSLALDVDPTNLHKSQPERVRIPYNVLMKAANDEPIPMFYKSLFAKLRTKFSAMAREYQKFRFNKGKPLEPLKFGRKIVYDPRTGKAITNEQFMALANDVGDFLEDKMGNIGDMTILRAALLGKMMHQMEKGGIPIEKQKRMSWKEVEDRFGPLPEDEQEARERMDLTPAELNAIRFAKAKAGEFLSIHDGKLRNQLVTAVRNQITQGLQDGIDAHEVAQRLFWMDPKDEKGKPVNKDTLEEYNRNWRRVAITETKSALSNGYLMSNKEEARKGEKQYFVFAGRWNPDEPARGPNSCNQFLGKICLLIDHPVEDDTDVKGDPYADFVIWVGKTNVGRGKDTWCCIPVHPHCTHWWERAHPDLMEWDPEIGKMVFKVPLETSFRKNGKMDLVKSVEEDKKNSKKNIVIDVDGTLFEYGKYTPNEFGEPKKDMIKVLNELKNRGYKITIFTARKDNERTALVNHLEFHDVPYDELIMGKPIGKYYIDDRAIEFKDNWKKIGNIIKSQSDLLDLLKNDAVQGRTNYNGLDIDIEWRKGTTRQWKGSSYRNHMAADYGYIINTDSPDGEEIDVYLCNPAHPEAKVFMLLQLKKDGNFDEHKFMLGFPNKKTAEEAYKRTMPPDMFGGIVEMEFKDFKKNMVKFYQKKALRKSDVHVDNIEWPKKRASIVQEELTEFARQAKEFLKLKNPIIVHLYKGSDGDRGEYDEGVILLYEHTPDWRGDFCHELGHQLIRKKTIDSDPVTKIKLQKIQKEVEKNKGDGRVFVQEHTYSNIKEIAVTFFKWWLLGKIVNDAYSKVLNFYQPEAVRIIEKLLNGDEVQKSSNKGDRRLFFKSFQTTPRNENGKIDYNQVPLNAIIVIKMFGKSLPMRRVSESTFEYDSNFAKSFRDSYYKEYKDFSFEISDNGRPKDIEKVIEFVKSQIEQNKKDSRKNVVVDVDGTIFEYKHYVKNKFGDPIKDAVETLNEIKENGYTITLHTARGEDEKEALEKHLKKYQINYDKLVMGKPIGKFYIDDRAIHFENNWSKIKSMIKSIQVRGT